MYAEGTNQPMEEAMTRKDYEMLAQTIRPMVDNARQIMSIGTDEAGLVARSKANTLCAFAYNLVQRLMADNSRFDHVKFYEACGFTVEENYPEVF